MSSPNLISSYISFFSTIFFSSFNFDDCKECKRELVGGVWSQHRHQHGRDPSRAITGRPTVWPWSRKLRRTVWNRHGTRHGRADHWTVGDETRSKWVCNRAAYPTRPHADSSLQVPLSESDRDLLRRRRITGFSPASREICRVERTAAVEYQSVEEKIRGSTKRAYNGRAAKKGKAHIYALLGRSQEKGKKKRWCSCSRWKKRRTTRACRGWTRRPAVRLDIVWVYLIAIPRGARALLRPPIVRLCLLLARGFSFAVHECARDSATTCRLLDLGLKLGL